MDSRAGFARGWRLDSWLTCLALGCAAGGQDLEERVEAALRRALGGQTGGGKGGHVEERENREKGVEAERSA